MHTAYSQYGSQVELCFSTECRAFRVRVPRSSQASFVSGLVEGLQWRDRQDAPGSTGVSWSPMMWDGTVHACVTEWWSSGGLPGRERVHDVGPEQGLTEHGVAAGVTTWIATPANRTVLIRPDSRSTAACWLAPAAEISRRLAGHLS